jgi:DNA-binding transcriptional LysR family regulator
MNWDDARVLLAVYRSRNVTAAAAALGVSHTTVARRIAALQRDLDVRLLARTPEGLRLTEAGVELARLAEAMEAGADAMCRRVAGAERRLRGTVRLTTTEGIGARLLAPRLPDLAARHPGLVVELLPDPRSLSLARREADLAVRLVRPHERATAGRRLGSFAYAAYASRAYLAGPRAPERLLAYGPPVARGEEAWLQRRFPGAVTALRSASTVALAAAVVAGGGIGVLPCFVGDAEGELVRLSGPEELPASELWLVVHRDLRRSAPVAAVADFVVEVLARQAPLLDGRQAGPSARG